MRKSRLSTIILILMLIVGLSLLLYPSFSNYWNSFRQSYAVASYIDEVTKLDDQEYDRIWNEAVSYNQKLLERNNSYALTENLKKEYEKNLNVTGNGVMGYINIPSIKVNLPIYHGIDETVLQVAIGHLDWTSLPTGGMGTHCVVSGHRGLPSARLFTDLDQMREGDIFIINVLDQILTYEVDRILIVEPHEVNSLKIEEGQDLCTLVTCTPYGVNSHRLLVRGHRVENEVEAETVRITNDAIQIEPLLIAPMVATPILIGLLVMLFASGKKKGRK